MGHIAIANGMRDNDLMEKVFAVMTSTNPDPIFVRGTVRALLSQTQGLIIFDNNSRPEIKQELMKLSSEFSGFVFFIWKPENMGVGESLNSGARMAIAHGAEWVLTLDDDSTPAPNMVQTMLSAYHDLPQGRQDSIGLITPNCTLAQGLAFPDGEPSVNNNGGITSGQLVKTSILPRVGFWNGGLFMDSVDGEFSCRVRLYGFLTILVPRALLRHSVGHPTLKRFLWKTAVVPNYAPYRYYYLWRNSIWLYVRNFPTYVIRNDHRGDALWALIIPRFFIKMILFENKRKEKIRASWHGIVDGLRGRLGRMPGQISN